MVTWIQILEVAYSISVSANTRGKGMNKIILPSVIGK